jgi:hypothetical protein
MKNLYLAAFLHTGVLAVAALNLLAQGPPPGPPPTARAAAPEDITGWWVSVITEDWRWRMQTPAAGDFSSIPVNPAGRKAAEAWNPDKDEALGEACRAYGAPGVMRLPTRLHITWQDDTTLKLETDEGTQTRLFHFGAKPPANTAASWQGYSVARWDISRPTNMGFMPPPTGGKPAGSLEATTTHLKPGYHRKNGIPYSADAVLTEYFTRTNEANGDSWLLLTAITEDPQYLNSDFLISSHFKREPDGTKWIPSTCSAR